MKRVACTAPRLYHSARAPSLASRFHELSRTGPRFFVSFTELNPNHSLRCARGTLPLPTILILCVPPPLYPYLLTLFYRPPPLCLLLLPPLLAGLESAHPRVPPLRPRFHTPFASPSACRGRDRGGAVVDPPSRGLDVSKLCDVCALYHLLGLKQIIGFSIFSLGLYSARGV